MRITNLLSVFACFCVSYVFGQTQTENYVQSTSYQAPYSVVQIEQNQVFQDDEISSVNYFDGLGRSIQSVSIRAGGGKEDLMVPVLYDKFGRTTHDFLPFPNLGNNGEYNIGLITPLLEYYYTNFSEDRNLWDINAYTETRFEDSPIGRVSEVGAPGKDWEVSKNSDTDRTIKYEYKLNNFDNLYRFKVDFPSSNNFTPELVFNGWHQNLTGYISKTITKDENWQPGDGNNHTVHEFKNKLGQVLLKRAFNQGIAHDTYYVYDDYGNLTFVLSPEASKQIIVSNNLHPHYSIILDELGYQYEYDDKNRLIRKKIPGKGWESIVYNQRDEVAYTQDAELSKTNKWLFTKYDALGRVAYTGQFTYLGDRAALQSQVDAATVVYEHMELINPSTNGGMDFYYSDDVLPTSNYDIYTINYYDQYIDHSGVVLSTDVFGLNTTTVNTTGLPTVSKTRVLNTDDWIVTITGYDQKGRAIYSSTKNEFLNSLKKIYSKLDFVGKVEETRTTQSKTNNATITVRDYFNYDHAGRLLQHHQKIDDSPVQLLYDNHYDDLGRLIRKDVGGESFIAGYTDISDFNVSSSGTVSKISDDGNWSAKLHTKGVIPGGYDGGIQASMVNHNKVVRMGLVKTSGSSLSNDHFDYAVQTNQSGESNKVYLVIDGQFYDNSGLGYAGGYVEGDTFKVERNANTIEFYKSGQSLPFYTVPLVDNEDEYIGKLAMTGSAGSVENLTLFGDKIDKKLQTVDYTYNIRGWLKTINDVNDNNPKSNDLFKFKINYNTVEGTYLANDVEPLYNGNISETIWRTKNDNTDKRSYGYMYDDLNRILKGANRTGENLDVVDNLYTFSLWNMSYDRNGNIQTLRRSGKYVHQFYDDLQYSYVEYNGINTNRLLGVEDLSDPSYAAHEEGFNDGNDSAIDYSYDDNGNLKTDDNKNIVSITYNHLNLPTHVTILDNGVGGYLEYVYAADGTKIQKTFTESGVVGNPVTTQYDGGFIYQQLDGQDNILQFFPHPEGYVEPTPVIPAGGGDSKSVKGFDIDSGQITFSAYRYVFQFKDHLGNIRLSYTDDDLDGSVSSSDIIEESNFYPFGLKHKGYNDIVEGGNDVAQNWKYNGKELNQELGLDWYDYGARRYDPTIARWTTVDPFSDVYSSFSPYSYVVNNPINAVDPDGQLIIFVNGNHYGSGGKKKYWGSFADKVGTQLKDHNHIFIDGSMGGYAGLYGIGPASAYRSRHLSATSRYEEGYAVGKAIAQAIIEGLANGETIKIITHSMGGAWARGLAKALEKAAKEMGITDRKLLTLIADFDPFQASSLVDVENTFIQQYLHKGILADQRDENADEVHVDEDESSHSIASFVNDISNLEEGEYEWNSKTEEWVCISCKEEKEEKDEKDDE